MKKYPCGTTTSYVWDKCRCEKCRAVMNAHQKRRYRLMGYTGKPLRATDDETKEISDRVEALMKQGWNKKELASRAGFSTSPMNMIAPYRGGKIQRRILDALTDVVNKAERGEIISDYAIADKAIGRVATLIHMGYSLQEISDATGLTRKHISQVGRGLKRPYPRTAQIIHEGFEALTARKAA